MKKIRLFGLLLLVMILCLTLTACAKKLIGITLNTDNVKKEFTVGDAFSYDGLIVTAHYNRNRSEAVKDFTVSTPDMATAGSKTVTVTYSDMTADYQITVSEPVVKPDPNHVLDSITINTDNVTKTFAVGDTFTYAGLVVTGHFQTEPLTEVIETGYTVSTPDMSTAGNKTVTVTYLGKTADYTIYVAPRVLQSISLNVSNVKRDYTVNDAFTYQGLVVTAHYNSAPLTETVTDYTVNVDELDMSCAGQKTVVITYQGKMASYEIVVHEPVLVLDRIEVDATNAKKTFVVGDVFSASGIVVTAYYLNGNPATVKDYEVSKPDMTTSGTKTVTVRYQGKTANYQITVNEPALTSIAVDASGATTVFTVGSQFSYEGIVVTARYSNKTYKEVTDYTVNVNELDMDTPGVKTVTVTYQGLNATYDITVKAGELVSIEVDYSLAKTEYFVGEIFTARGIVVTAYYDDESSETVTGYSVSEPDMNTVGIKTVKVSYQGKEAEYSITVEEAPIETFPEVYDGQELFLEAELSIREGSCDVQRSMGRGGAFVGNIANGDKLTFAFKSNVTATVEIYLAISHGNSGIANALDVSVNGDKLSSYDVVNSGSWQTIKEFLVCKAELKAGLNIIVIDAVNTKREVNIDYLKIAPSTTDQGNQGGVNDNEMTTNGGSMLKLAYNNVSLAAWDSSASLKARILRDCDYCVVPR
ncbi:MAG: bacterial Ig-like domain-containing protein [Clostridiales bacterium]|nr:bacterial Ig-like domain-containing protein [Clostridiales bacterium]